MRTPSGTQVRSTPVWKRAYARLASHAYRTAVNSNSYFPIGQAHKTADANPINLYRLLYAQRAEQADAAARALKEILKTAVCYPAQAVLSDKSVLSAAQATSLNPL